MCGILQRSVISLAWCRYLWNRAECVVAVMACNLMTNISYLPTVHTYITPNHRPSYTLSRYIFIHSISPLHLPLIHCNVAFCKIWYKWWFHRLDSLHHGQVCQLVQMFSSLSLYRIKSEVSRLCQALIRGRREVLSFMYVTVVRFKKSKSCQKHLELFL